MNKRQLFCFFPLKQVMTTKENSVQEDTQPRGCTNELMMLCYCAARPTTVRQDLYGFREQLDDQEDLHKHESSKYICTDK